MEALNVPRPSWMSEDLVLLEESARRFFAAEFVPHIDKWNEQGIMDRSVWTKAGEAGLAHQDATSEQIREGAEATLRQLKSALERNRVVEINPAAGAKNG